MSKDGLNVIVTGSASGLGAATAGILAKGGAAEGKAVMDAVHAGGSFAAYQRAFATISPEPRRRRSLSVLAQGGGSAA